MGEHESIHEGSMIPSGEHPDRTRRWHRVLRSRYLAAGVTAVVLVAGLLLAGRLGIGGTLLPGIGLAALMMGGHLFMRGGHSHHGGQGGLGSDGSSRSGRASPSDTADDPDPTHKTRKHSGCH